MLRRQNMHYHDYYVNNECSYVIVSERAKTAIISEVLAHGNNETGGILLGNFHNGIWYVTESIDPGLDSSTVHKVGLFRFDDKYINHLVEKVSALYKYPLTIIGVWHRHPGSMDTFSSTDFESLADMTNDARIGLLSMLVNIDPDLRMTFYYCNKKGEVIKMPFDCGDEYFLPNLMDYVEPDDLIKRNHHNFKFKNDVFIPAEQVAGSIAYVNLNKDIKTGAKSVVESDAEETEPVVESDAEETKSVVESDAEETKSVVESDAEETEPVVESDAEETEPVVESVAEETEPVVESVAEKSKPVSRSVGLQNIIVRFLNKKNECKYAVWSNRAFNTLISETTNREEDCWGALLGYKKNKRCYVVESIMALDDIDDVYHQTSSFSTLYGTDLSVVGFWNVHVSSSPKSLIPEMDQASKTISRYEIPNGVVCAVINVDEETKTIKFLTSFIDEEGKVVSLKSKNNNHRFNKKLLLSRLRKAKLNGQKYKISLNK